MSFELEFIGAAQTVTGSRHLLHVGGRAVLLDCGLFQGRRAEAREKNLSLGVDPAGVDAVVLSHAHIDHSGALPHLCRAGYGGPIYATPATRDLCAAMLEDAAMLQEADARYLNRRAAREHLPGPEVEPLFTTDDVTKALTQMLTVPYHRRVELLPQVGLTFLDAGHVLGSAVSVLELGDTRVAFTGDLGRPQMPILREPEVPAGVSVLLLESTYGDRLHPPRRDMDDELAAIISATAARGGKVLIPSFALERAQELLLSLEKLRRANRIPHLPVYVDSPLTVDLTAVFRMHPDCYDAEARALLEQDRSPFAFEGLRFISSKEDSVALDRSTEPSIIISASGMCEGGRVLHHLQALLPDPRHTVVVVGFQAQHTLGRRLVEGRRRVRVFGVELAVHAEVRSLAGFSAHADQADLLRFVEAVRARGPLREVVLVHGEPPAQQVLAGRLRALGLRVHVPAPGDRLQLEGGPP